MFLLRAMAQAPLTVHHVKHVWLGNVELVSIDQRAMGQLWSSPSASHVEAVALWDTFCLESCAMVICRQMSLCVCPVDKRAQHSRRWAACVTAQAEVTFHALTWSVGLEITLIPELSLRVCHVL
jgi:hypothetical protein